MYYIVYKTFNLINGKEYTGVHNHKKLNSKYLGSGTFIKRAIKKYGKENFVRINIFVFDNPEDMFLKESEIVTEEYCARNDTYNLRTGGTGGYKHNEYSKKIMSEKRIGKYKGDKSYMYGKSHSEETKIRISDSKKGQGKGNNWGFKKNSVPHNKDHKIYHFYHKDIGNLMVTRHELVERFGLPNSNMTKLLKGKLNSVKGWIRIP